MKSRLALITVFLSLFGLVLASQINMVNAQTVTPLTSPITNPVTYFTYRISGKVTYTEITRRFFKSLKPAHNVIITAMDVKTRKTYTTKTDINGNYALNVNNGTYLIVPQDNNRRTVFTPSYRYINVTKNITNLDFTGIIRK